MTITLIILIGVVWGLASGINNIDADGDENKLYSLFMVYVVIVAELKYAQYGLRNPF